MIFLKKHQANKANVSLGAKKWNWWPRLTSPRETGSLLTADKAVDKVNKCSSPQGLFLPPRERWNFLLVSSILLHKLPPEARHRNRVTRTPCMCTCTKEGKKVCNLSTNSDNLKKRVLSWTEMGAWREASSTWRSCRGLGRVGSGATRLINQNPL